MPLSQSDIRFTCPVQPLIWHSDHHHHHHHSLVTFSNFCQLGRKKFAPVTSYIFWGRQVTLYLLGETFCLPWQTCNINYCLQFPDIFTDNNKFVLLSHSHVLLPCTSMCSGSMNEFIHRYCLIWAVVNFQKYLFQFSVVLGCSVWP
jgi:hypothetical protein